MPRPRLPSPPSAFLQRQQRFSSSALAYRPTASTCESTRTAAGDEPIVLPSLQQRAQQRIAQRDVQAAPVSPFLTDSYGRQHDYLRISLTEKCNLRCTYCMPESGVPLLPSDDLLTTDEVERVARLFVANGVSKIRLTGGEPTVRKDLLDVVSRLGRLPLTSLGMTSNGIALKRKLPALVDAGLTHLNISLDTLDPFKYELMTRRRGFSAVMEALEVAQGLKSKGLKTKINMVVVKGLNDMEVPDFVEMTRDMDITVRAIEFMPFEDNRWSTKKLVPSAELVSRIKQVHPTLSKLRDPHSDTTRTWQVPGYKGKVGFISSMSDHFCGECSRLRVGADGGVKVCLFGPPVLSLRPLLRAEAPSPTTDEHLMQQIGAAVWGKKFAHNGLGGPDGIARDGKMGSMVGIGASKIHSRARHHQGSFNMNSTRFTRPKGSTVPLHLLPSIGTTLGLRYSSSSSRSYDRSPPTLSSTVTTSTSNATAESSPDHLTHIDPLTGRASMVSVSSKEVTLRSATAVGSIFLNEAAWQLIDFGESVSNSSGAETTMRTKKGDVLTISHLAAIMSAKHTSTLIPLCHPLLLTSIKATLTPHPSTRSIEVRATVECEGKTGVEMEALTAVSVGCLTVWDMTKAVSGMESRIGEIRVVRKSGGRSGDWVRGEGEGR